MRELSLHLLDVLENALRAGATHVAVKIDEDAARNLLTMSVRDNGRGMDRDTLGRLGDPFYTTRTEREVGLGIALLRAAAERCNGTLQVASRVGEGTEVTATFQRDHIDRAPLGDVPGTILAALLADPRVDLTLCHRANGRELHFDTRELRAELGDVPLDQPRVRAWIAAYLKQCYTELYDDTPEEEGHAETLVD